MLIDPANTHACTPELYQQLMDMIKKQQLAFHQFYNVEVETDELPYLNFMQTYKDNQATKVLNKTYYDIETYGVDENGEIVDEFPEVDKAAFPVNAVALYNNVTNEATIISYVNDCNITDPVALQIGVEEYYAKTVIENQIYEIPDLKIIVEIVENEKQLFQSFHTKIHSLDTLMLIGFNSSLFDDAYMMNRGSKLFSDEVYHSMVSEFQVTKYSSRVFEWPDYLLVDLLKLYQPVDSGGMGLGQSLSSYKLDNIAEVELGIQKLDLDGGFVKTYRNNIVQYLTYNMMDTLLTFKLDQKLQFIEQIYSLSKYNNSSIGATINGRSIMYKYRNDLIYANQKKLVRAKKYSREVFYQIEKEVKK
jgi:DNA polymerase elongation subunit (family B)